MSTGKDQIFEEMKQHCSECGNELTEAERDGMNMCSDCVLREYNREVDEFRLETERIRVEAFAATLRARRQNEKMERDSTLLRMRKEELKRSKRPRRLYRKLSIPHDQSND